MGQQLSFATIVAVALFATTSCRGAVESENGFPDAGTTGASDSGGVQNNGVVNNGVVNNGAGNNGGPSDMGGGTLDVSAGDSGGNADVREPPFDAGACGGATFGDSAFSLAPITGSGTANLHAAPTGSGGAIVGWRASDGIHVAHVDGGGGVVAETTVDGSALYGLAAHDGGRAVMVERGSDILALVILDASGNVVSDQTIIGDVPHDVTENEWFGSLIKQGTMTWTGTQWATYFTVQRLWNDGIAHYGDQLRLYDADGSSNSTVWGWGCSHSMEVKISHNGERLGPVCSSDCYPSKGVHFNHRGGQLWPDEAGSNCAGGYGTSLGASVPVPGGFWVAFTATDDRDSHDVALTKIDGTSPQEPVWLTADATADRQLRATNFEGDLVVAWNAGGTNQFVIASGADGSVMDGPVTIADAELSGASDFFVYANGDVGWVQPSNGGAALARLRACR